MSVAISISIQSTNPNFLVCLLTVTALLDDSHDDVLGGHERQLLSNPSSNDHGVYDETLGNILEGRQYDVGGEERLWEGDTSICTVKQSGMNTNLKYGNEGVI